MSPNETFNAIVLAAGLGTRMRPITTDLPKPLVSICNRPLLENILINLEHAGADKIAVNTHYLAGKVRDFAGKPRWRDKVRLYHEETILGTGGPMVNARALLAAHESFMLHNGDILTDVDLKAMASFHRRTGADVTMLTLDGPENRLLTLPGGRIIDILGRTGAVAADASMLTYGGIMMIRREFFRYLPAEPCNCSSIAAITELIMKGGTVMAFSPGNFYWNDLGTIERYFQAHYDILVEQRCRIDELPETGMPQRDCAGGAGGFRRGKSGFICIGRGCRIAPGAMVENCILLDGAEVGPDEYHRNEIIGKDYSVHRDNAILQKLKILKDTDWNRVRISSLREYGSARGFFRLTDDSGSRVLMVSDAADNDFGRFVGLGRFMAANGLYTPEIYASDQDEYTVMMEDLGNEMLYNRWEKYRGDNAALAKCYRRVIDALTDFQLRGTALFRKAGAPPLRIFDYDYLRWETAYFTENFLQEICGLPPGYPEELGRELDALAGAVDKHPRILIHRDFQSQNIMLEHENVRFVDFQGARLGSPGYDIMSLLRDPYVRLSAGLRRDLLEYYANSVADAPAGSGLVSAEEVIRYAVTAALQRNMQALGAYGFLARRKGKTDYLRYIPQAVAYLREGIDELHSLSNAPRLSALDACWTAIADAAARHQERQ